MDSFHNPNTQLQRLLHEYGIVRYEVWPHYGRSLTYGRLKKLIIYDHFIHIPEPFHKIGFGIVNRRSYAADD